MTFIVSSYFIEGLGNEDVEIFFRKVWKKLVKPFSRALGHEEQDK
jgi:hypothetical protein